MFTAGVRADDQVYVHRRLSDQELLYFFGWIYFSVKKQTNKTSEVKRSKVVLVASFSSIEKWDRTLEKKKSGEKSLSKEEEEV